MRIKFISLFLIIILMAVTYPSRASRPDSLSKPFKASPRKASLYSMALPGLGQAYNKKYWKIPIIYAGVGALTYFGINNYSEYKKWGDAYEYKVTNQTYPYENDLPTRYTADQLLSQKNYYRRNFEVTILLGTLLYVLNIVDAAVDAHLSGFDVSDNLSVNITSQPLLNPKLSSNESFITSGAGLTLSLKL